MLWLSGAKRTGTVSGLYSSDRRHGHPLINKFDQSSGNMMGFEDAGGNGGEREAKEAIKSIFLKLGPHFKIQFENNK